MKTFGLSVLSPILGYIADFLVGMLLLDALSSNPHDKSIEAAMPGAFVVGPWTIGRGRGDDWDGNVSVAAPTRATVLAL